MDYVSQIIQNIKTGKIYVLPIEDPENVDKWRAKALMPPMKSFLGQYGIDWSLDQYYQDLKKFRIVKPGQYEFLE